MSNKVEVSIQLKPETIDKIEEIVTYCKFRKKFTDRDLPVSQEDVIKAALDEYLNKIDVLYQGVINYNLYKLNSTDPIKNKIKELISETGMKQKEFANLTGINQGALSHILSNRNQPSLEIFLRIWVVLGCPPIEHMFYRESP